MLTISPMFSNYIYSEDLQSKQILHFKLNHFSFIIMKLDVFPVVKISLMF